MFSPLAKNIKKKEIGIILKVSDQWGDERKKKREVFCFIPRESETKISLLEEPRNVIEMINLRARLGLVVIPLLPNCFTSQVG